ncbi:fumarylacetoacetate hydrolase family protein [Actinomycetes bacterium NPDC127524]
MKFGTIRSEGKSVLVLVEEEKLLLLQKAAVKSGIEMASSLEELIKNEESELNKAKSIQKWVKEQKDTEGYYINFERADWEAPIPRPSKNIFCVGKNYTEHAKELGSEADIPTDIMMFTKAPTSVIGNKADIPIHSQVTSQLDYEGELAVIIGKKGKGISREKALDYVFGYTILNDVTARDLQEKHKQFFLGKSLDGTCPIGPVIVHKSQIGNPGSLEILTKVNGDVRQQSNTSQLIFPVEEIISVISKGMTLEPGDIIATGTPAGVGKGMKPPVYLKSGDKIEVTIGKIGTLSNSVR